MTKGFSDRQGEYLARVGITRSGGFDAMSRGVLREASASARQMGHPEAFDRRVMDDNRAVWVGSWMEQTADMLKAINIEVQQSKETLQSLANEVRAVHDIVGPQLLQQATALRTARMTVVSEIRESLAAMQDVRRFFLEPDHAVQVERLERFVRLCRDLQELKADGVFDAVCDSALRLAIGAAK